MDTPLTIVFQVQQGRRGVFRYGEEYDGIVEQLDAATDARDGGALTDKKYLSTLSDLVGRHPDFIDGHAHIGIALLAQGNPKLALKAYLHGLEVGERALPERFSGRIEWISHDNRPFLRAALGTAVCYCRLRRHADALAMMERILK